MTADDKDDIWSLYAKGVKRIGEKPAVEPRATKPRSKSTKPKKQEEPLFGLQPVMVLAEEQAETKIETLPKTADAVPPLVSRWKKEPLDLRIERNMSLGDVVIEAKLDLHGQTERQAHEHFSSFVEQQRARGKRMLLVITGKGQDGTSVLRSNLPRWCETGLFAESVLAVRTAAQHHGGEGAYYVLLRKKN